MMRFSAPCSVGAAAAGGFCVGDVAELAAGFGACGFGSPAARYQLARAHVEVERELFLDGRGGPPEERQAEHSAELVTPGHFRLYAARA